MRPAAARHIAEMRIVIAEGCTLAQAKDKLARMKWQAGQAALEAVKFGVTRLEYKPLPDWKVESDPALKPYWWNRDL